MPQPSLISAPWSRPDGRPEAVPKYATPRRSTRMTFGNRINAICASINGRPLMPWQKAFADVAGEFYLDDAGRPIPYYREAFFSTPRQSGKTELCLAWAIERCFNWVEAWGPQRVAWTAQTGDAVRAKLNQEVFPRLEDTPIMPLVDNLTRSSSNTAVVFRNGSRVVVVGSKKSAGHGLTIPAAILDEIWVDEDWRRFQFVVPAMATRADGQMLLCSTAGLETSFVFNSKRREGREAVIEGRDEGLCYVEYGAPDDGWNPEDEESWWGFMPALGHTIAPSTVRQALHSAGPNEFERGFGNLTQRQVGLRVIPDSLWDRVSHENVSPQEPITVGACASEDRTHGAIAVADRSGRVELVEYGPSPTLWMAEKVNELCSKYDSRCYVDAAGPLRPITPQIEYAEELNTATTVAAVGWFFSAITEGRAHIRRAPELDDAVTHVAKRTVGDNWVWSRTASPTDVSPLYAATLALWGAQQQPPEPFFFTGDDLQ